MKISEAQLSLFAPVGFQVLVCGQPMHPTGGAAYLFATYEKAAQAVDMCYGLGSLGKFTEIQPAPPPPLPL